MDRRSQVPALSMTSVAAMAAMVVVMLSGACTTDAYAFGPAPSSSRLSSPGKVRYSPTAVKKAGGRGIHKRREDGSAVTLYLFPTPPSVSAGNHRQQRPRSGSLDSAQRPKTSLPAMSDSVLAASDILPSFHTAHGLLSPEVVMRIADTNDPEQGGPLHKFLKTYKSRGPMACLPMLSDPCILPELTRAMREIA
mmetsp:Transcript_716/g.1501  ORF Transcript_716/g.1501 Transcript_716/m.1501 type:complete len:194 (-) Transcript_716:524-1105(-)|eukprot:CAMPEP_0201867060 /NCGR_PEP_ID=MMETSP0902-20130614/1445_1 /ASSEMBLY_ACC=CAM_ASM_000551 /TAXON_ID=420261 /ORGANISM="Thalassiosira antarctica, Strain CCMP982" /LENGTH=193 /DNA_ID=CAMNT_0048392169 /DNA_START=33 /DNA_END=614 /DNA_ORIENTATION=+